MERCDPMVKMGMLIGERYEILEKIGTGGMSDVYKAIDHKLNRPVAIKVLKQEFSENENFVSKFRTEAQAADWDIEGTNYYFENASVVCGCSFTVAADGTITLVS